MVNILFFQSNFRSPVAYKLLNSYLKTTSDVEHTFDFSFLKKPVQDFFMYYKKEPRKSVASLTPLPLFLIMLKNYSQRRDIFYNIEEEFNKINFDDSRVDYDKMYQVYKNIKDELSSKIKNDTHIVCLQPFIYNTLSELMILTYIRQEFPNIIIVLGGYTSMYHKSYMALLEYHNLYDSRVLGFGEESFKTIVENIEDNKSIYLEYYNDSMPDYRYPIYHPAEKKIGSSLYTSRGCNKRCTICVNGNAPSKKMQKVPVEEFASWIKRDYIDNNVRSFQLADHHFPLTKDYMSKLLSILEKENILGNISFRFVYPRLSVIDDFVAEGYSKLNFILCAVGVENYNQRILNLMNKGGSVEENIRVMNLFHKYNINHTLLNVFGFPTETMPEFMVNYKEFARLLEYEERKILGINFYRPAPEIESTINCEKFGFKLVPFPDIVINYYPEISHLIDNKDLFYSFYEINDPNDKRYHTKIKFLELMKAEVKY